MIVDLLNIRSTRCNKITINIKSNRRKIKSLIDDGFVLIVVVVSQYGESAGDKFGIDFPEIINRINTKEAR